MKHKEDLVLKLLNLEFPILLTVEFDEKDDFYEIKASKINLSMESTTNNLEEAKEEFIDIVLAIFSYWIEKDILVKVFKYYNFEKKEIEQITKEKLDELKHFIKINKEKDKEFNLFVNPSTSWQPQETQNI